MMPNITYSVVIPVYNSTDSLPELVSRLKTTFTEVVQDTFEIILVNDGSPKPQTWDIMQALAEQHPEVVAIRLMRNFGKTGAVLCGFSHIHGLFVFTLDDDLQHHPEDIPKFITQQEHDVVIGVFEQRQHGWIDRLTSAIKNQLEYYLLHKPRHIRSSPFKLYRAEVIRAMLQIKTPYPSIPALIFYVTQDVVMIPIGHASRKYGKSEFNFYKRVSQFSNLLINNSSLLLRIAATLGITVSFLSFLLGLLLALRNLIYDIAVPGWTSLVVATMILNGLVLFSIGVIGEYLIRMLHGIEARPAFIVREIYQPKEN